MKIRHLFPDEIERLADGPDGWLTAPARIHLNECADCRAELERATAFQAVLDDLPDFVPAPGFADRVMHRVQVFEPWHVALARTVTRVAPASTPARVAVGTGALAGGGVAVAGAWWALNRADVALLLAQVGIDRVHDRFISAADHLGAAILGQPGVEALRAASPELAAVAVMGFAALAGAGVLALRTLAAASTRAD